MNTNRTSWQSEPYIYIVAPTCPRCDCAKYDRVRTADNGDGSRTKRVICRDCGQRFNIVVELPDTGNREIDTE